MKKLKKLGAFGRFIRVVKAREDMIASFPTSRLISLVL